MTALEHLPMTKTELRVMELAYEHVELGGEPNLDAGLSDSGVLSVDAFIEKVGEAFGTSIPAEAVAGFKNMRDLVAYLDSHTG